MVWLLETHTLVCNSGMLLAIRTKEVERPIQLRHEAEEQDHVSNRHTALGWWFWGQEESSREGMAV
jgi:hypothetical protein